jgi:hypothetical protein
LFVGLSTEKANDLKGDCDLIVEHPDPEINKGLMSANEERDEKKKCHKGEGHDVA